MAQFAIIHQHQFLGLEKFHYGYNIYFIEYIRKNEKGSTEPSASNTISLKNKYFSAQMSKEKIPGVFKFDLEKGNIEVDKIARDFLRLMAEIKKSAPYKDKGIYILVSASYKFSKNLSHLPIPDLDAVKSRPFYEISDKEAPNSMKEHTEDLTYSGKLLEQFFGFSSHQCNCYV